jgi:UDP-glucose 4-epimerase
MKLASVKSLIFSSSATVYGEPEYLPYDEDHPTKPINVYGRTKLHVEKILSNAYASDPEWSIVCLRYFNPVGPHGSGLIGEDPKGIPNNLMPYLTWVASGSLPQLNIFGGDYDTADGTCVRDFIHVLDLVDGHLSALSCCHLNHRYDVINLGTGQGVRVLEMLKYYECATGLSIPYEIVSRRVGDLPRYYASAEKAKTLLKWQSKRGPDDMCLSAWKFQSREKC